MVKFVAASFILALKFSFVNLLTSGIVIMMVVFCILLSIPVAFVSKAAIFPSIYIDFVLRGILIYYSYKY